MWQTSTETFTTKRNKVLLIIFISGVFIQACQRDLREPVSQELLAGFRLSVQERFQQGDTLPYPWLKLKTVFPASIDGFESQKISGGTFSPDQDRFSAVSKFYTDEAGKYLFIKLSDYAADSSAFNFWLNGRDTQTKLWPGESGTVIIEDQKEALISRTSAIRGSRYQIHLATNHPEGQQILHQALGNLQWEELK